MQDKTDAMKLPPHDLEAERAILGALLVAPKFDAVSEILSEQDFYLTRHQAIFTAMRRLWARHEPIDILTVADELSRSGDLERVGGRAEVAQIMADVAGAGQVLHHAKIVRELASLRAIKTIAMQMQLDAEALKRAEEVARDAEQRLFAALWQRQISAWIGNDEVIRDSLDHIDLLQRTPGGNVGITTGLRDLDRLLHGLQPSDLVVVAARPAMGKTSFGVGVALAAARQGKRVAIASLEMTRRQIGFRFLSVVSGVSLHALTSGTMSDHQMSRVNYAAVHLEPLPIHYVDANPMSIDLLRSMARQQKIQNGLDVLIVDYLQLMDNPNRRRGARQEDVAEISRGLKLMAKELDICVVALSQLSRKPEDRPDRRPMLADLRESGAIEQDADVVIMLYRDEVYDDESPDRGVAEILIRKHRNGPTGDVRVSYLAECAKFADLALTN